MRGRLQRLWTHVQETAVVLSDSGLCHDKVIATTYGIAGAPVGDYPAGKYLVVSPQNVLEQEAEYGSNESFCPLGGIAPYRTINMVMEHDAYGNLKTSTRTTGDGYTDANTLSYDYDPHAWLVQKPKLSVASSSVPGGQTTTRTRKFITRPNTGEVAVEIVEPQGEEATYNRTIYDRDPHGVVTRITSRDLSRRQQRTLSLKFDQLEDLYPAKVTNAIGQTVRLAVHPAFGVLAVYEDANGIREQHQYDGFGQLKQVLAPGGANRSITYTIPGGKKGHYNTGTGRYLLL
jgi:YD repeat-containing protein